MGNRHSPSPPVKRANYYAASLAQSQCACVIHSVDSQWKEVAFLLEWQDATKNETLTPGVFRDGAAVALPIGNAPAFFCMGQLDHYVNIWHWKADWQSDVDRRAARAKEKKRRRKGPRRFEVIPRRPSSVEDLIGGGFSTLTSKQRQGRIKGQAEWKRGLWRVVMKRPLTVDG